MAPYLVLFGRAFPTYSLLALAGAAAAWGYFHWRLRRRGRTPAGRSRPSSGGAGALVGAKLLYLLPQSPQLAADLPAGAGPRPVLRPVPHRGFVFYGGRWGLGGGGALLPAAEGALRPVGGRPGARRPPLPRLWPGGVLFGRVLRHPRPGGVVGVTFPRPCWPPTGWPWCRCSCMRPPGASSSSCCWTGWPGGVVRGMPPVYLSLYGAFRFLLEFLRGTRPGGSGGPCPPPSGWRWPPWRWPLPVLLWRAIQTKPPAATLRGAAGGFS